MGNGADKILAVCAARGISVAGVFASDGFVRGHSFHGMRVATWSEIKETYGAENVIVLLSFATSLPDVMERIRSIAAEAELYIPDVPVFGDGLFDAAYARAHWGELEATAELFCDARSREVFWQVVAFRLSGRIEHLEAAFDARETTVAEILRPGKMQTALDLGAYNGDSVRAWIADVRAAGGCPRRIWAMEPDARNFRKLSAYAETETEVEVIPVPAAAWSREETLVFEDSGNRNASVGDNRSSSLSERPRKVKEIAAMAPDSVLAGASVDYIKYDVEGSEAEALAGSERTIDACHPMLAVSLYHRIEDLWRLPLRIRERHPEYRGFALRLPVGIPAWDLMLYCWK
jgi:FkbM family methyltransferase